MNDPRNPGPRGQGDAAPAPGPEGEDGPQGRAADLPARGDRAPARTLPPAPTRPSPAADAPPPSSERGLPSLLRRSLKSAFVAWVRQRTPGRSLRPQDEATHPWDGSRSHAEDYTFVAVQPDLAAVIRLEWLPDRDTHRLWIILLGEDAVHATPGTGQILLRSASARDEGPWSVGGLVLDCVEPFRQWTITYHGTLAERSVDGEPRLAGEPGARTPVIRECRVDLTFVADVAPFVPGADDDPELLARRLGAADWDAELLRGLRRRRTHGYVQVGAIHGTIALGDRILAISAAGLRHHTWGQRDWGASDRALQCFVARGPGQRLWIHRAHFPGLTLEGGFVAEAGARAAIRELGVTLERRPAGAPGRVGLDLASAAGEVAIDAAAVSQISLEMDGRGRLDLAFLRVAGDPRGVGLWVGQERLLPRPSGR
ncbi:MAG: hypothetical protein R3B09_16165 [Nannocystaceae bacterium]